MSKKSAKSSLGMATSAIWKVTYFACRITLAPYQLRAQRGQRPVFNLLGQSQRAQKIAEIVSQGEQLQPHFVVSEVMAGQPRRGDLAFLDSIGQRYPAYCVIARHLWKRLITEGECVLGFARTRSSAVFEEGNWAEIDLKGGILAAMSARSALTPPTHTSSLSMDCTCSSQKRDMRELQL